ncbi:hypothetical protein [Gracilibacillus salinarum]|uniref:Lipoprotein n=1 Tax=Gracilibacillus salinarum TaxID=2932255 RepID=A0ABY4GH35_9BACI|nr:hypothetical protein [Gracilibacillus salinarum]UOQ83536.1 hypothetical protein MUN87_12285 [Gracilibacillus salinarum]
MKRIIFFVFLLLLLLLTYCTLNKVPHNEELRESVFFIVKDKSNTEISMNTLTDFDWDKGFLIPPYSSQESIDKQLGVHFSDPSSIDFRDDIYLFVFMKDNEVVQYVEMDVQDAKFTLGGRKYLTPLDDVIIIERY